MIPPGSSEVWITPQSLSHLEAETCFLHHRPWSNGEWREYWLVYKMVLIWPRVDLTEGRGYELSWVNTQSSCPMKKPAQNLESLPLLISIIQVIYECWWWPQQKGILYLIFFSWIARFLLLHVLFFFCYLLRTPINQSHHIL